MDLLIKQLKEQVSMLGTFLHEERLRHRLEEETYRDRYQALIESQNENHQQNIENLEKKHENYMKLLKSQHKSILEILEKTYKERLKKSRNECTLMQAALRNYKDVVRTDMEKMWAKKVDMQTAETEEKISNAVRDVRLEMEKQFELEKEDIRSNYENEIGERVEEALSKVMELTESVPGFEVQTQVSLDTSEKPDSGKLESNVPVTSDAGEEISSGFVRRSESSKNVPEDVEQREMVGKTPCGNELPSVTFDGAGVMDTMSCPDTKRESMVPRLVLENVSDGEEEKTPDTSTQMTIVEEDDK